MTGHKNISASEKLIRGLYEISAHPQDSFTEKTNKLLQLGCDIFKLEIGIISTIEKNLYCIEYVHCPDDIGLHSGYCFDFLSTYCEITIKANAPVIFQHIKNSPIKNHPAYNAFKLESYIGMPIHIDGKLFGTLNFSSPTPRKEKFKSTDKDFLQLICQWFKYEFSSIDTSKKLTEANEKLTKMVAASKESYKQQIFDKMFIEHLHLTIRRQEPLSLVILDIDQFESLNDSVGHIEAGNTLTRFSTILSEKTRNSDIVSRFDDAAVSIILPATAATGALILANELCDYIANTRLSNSKITASFGITSYQPTQPKLDNTKDIINKLMQESKKALYQSKSAGGSQVTHFNSL